MTQEEMDKEIEARKIRETLDEFSARDKRALQAWGYYVRMTEWHDGFQVCIFKKNDIRKCYVSDWMPYENQAWANAWTWADQQMKLGL